MTDTGRQAYDAATQGASLDAFSEDDLYAAKRIASELFPVRAARTAEFAIRKELDRRAPKLTDAQKAAAYRFVAERTWEGTAR